MAPPFDVIHSGRMAGAMDTSGAAFGIWKASTHIGAQRFNEQGAPCWNELHTRQYDAAKNFFTSVFPIDFNDISDENFEYSIFKRAGDGQEVAGLHYEAQLPEGAPNYWLA